MSTDIAIEYCNCKEVVPKYDPEADVIYDVICGGVIKTVGLR